MLRLMQQLIGLFHSRVAPRLGKLCFALHSWVWRQVVIENGYGAFENLCTFGRRSYRSFNPSVEVCFIPSVYLQDCCRRNCRSAPNRLLKEKQWPRKKKLKSQQVLENRKWLQGLDFHRQGLITNNTDTNHFFMRTNRERRKASVRLRGNRQSRYTHS